jgi:cysteinyl-tRNA synthetase
LKIQNSLTGKKEEFVPIEQGCVRIYACGPTVYNYFHIGNARPFIVFDTLRRYLEYRGYRVDFVQNFTDVDDKMIAAAAKEGLSVPELGERYIAEYFKDAEALNIKKATHHPRATAHIEDIIRLIEKLIENGHAYEAGGDVYFDTASDPDYGKLSGQNLEDLEMGARIEVSDLKKNPMDFALWKAEKPGEIGWDSPWGKGRPGWHIECSAMSMKYLGDTIDIHGGGQDLLFPHHENEIAQSECATGKPFVNYWMHNGYINIDNKKMSKSEGNFFTVRDIRGEFDPIAVRLFMLGSHYANPINFTRELISQAESALARIKNCRENLRFIIENPKENPIDVSGVARRARRDFIAAMEEDLNTADAIGVLYEYIREINTLFVDGGDEKGAKEALSVLDELLGVLGLLPGGEDEEIPAEVVELAEKRAAARAKKDFRDADEIRDRIARMGYEVKDTPDGVKISKL